MKNTSKQTSISKDERVKSYLDSLQKLIEKLSGGDELIEILKQDSISEGFINVRIQEIVENELLTEKEIYIEKLLNENENLKKEQAKMKNSSFINNEKKDQSKCDIDSLEEKIKKIKQKYKKKYFKEKEKLYVENQELRKINQELMKNNESLNRNNSENEKKIQSFIKEIEDLKAKPKENSTLLKNKILDSEKNVKKIEKLQKNNKEILKQNEIISLENSNLKQKNEELLRRIEEIDFENKELVKEQSKTLHSFQNKIKYETAKSQSNNSQTLHKSRKILYMLQDLRKTKDLLLNLQKNISQTIEFYFSDFAKDLFHKLQNLNTFKKMRESKTLQKENERFLLEIQKLRSDKTMLEARSLTLKKEHEKNLANTSNIHLANKNELEKEISSLKQQIQEKNEIIDRFKFEHAEDLAKMKCDYLKEFNSLHNQLVKLNKNNETIAMKYEEELAFFQTNYLNDLRALKIEYRNKLETILNSTRNSAIPSINLLEYTGGGGIELEEIQSTLRNLLKLADKKQEQLKKNSNKYGNIPLPTRESVRGKFGSLKDISNINLKSSIHSREKSFESLKENI